MRFGVECTNVHNWLWPNDYRRTFRFGSYRILGAHVHNWDGWSISLVDKPLATFRNGEFGGAKVTKW